MNLRDDKGHFKKGNSGFWLGNKRPDISRMFKGREVTEETRKKISKTLKKNPVKYWLGKKRPSFSKLNRDPIFIEKKMKGLIKKPNKVESNIINLINNHKLPFKYVGDGQFILGGRCPDFLNCDGQKQVIEVFGRYWHDPSINNKVRLNRTYDGTVKHYKRYGFKCLILWDDELKNMSDDIIIMQIKEFMGGVTP